MIKANKTYNHWANIKSQLIYYGTITPSNYQPHEAHHLIRDQRGISLHGANLAISRNQGRWAKQGESKGDKSNNKWEEGEITQANMQKGR